MFEIPGVKMTDYLSTVMSVLILPTFKFIAIYGTNDEVETVINHNLANRQFVKYSCSDILDETILNSNFKNNHIIVFENFDKASEQSQHLMFKQIGKWIVRKRRGIKPPKIVLTFQGEETKIPLPDLFVHVSRNQFIDNIR